jgi:hypothetical protein
MASKTINWLEILSDFVQQHPKTSAAVAFNLGVIAAGATRRATILRTGVTEIPAKLIELVPSMKDLSAYVPSIGTAKTKPRRAPARKTPARKATASRSRRKAAG